MKPRKFFGEDSPEMDEKIAKKIFNSFNLSSFVKSPLVSKNWHAIFNSIISDINKSEPILTTKSVLQLLSKCSPFENKSPQVLKTAKQLSGGMTNTTYYVETCDEQKLIARNPGKNSAKFINRESEASNASVAANNQSAPDVFYTNRKGIQLTTFLDNSTPMTPELLKDKTNLALCVNALKKLHRCTVKFANNTNVFVRNNEMLSILDDHKVNLPDSYISVVQKLAPLDSLMQALQIPKVPCHNDTTPSNFLRVGNEVKLIDLEYSGNNDPLWDLVCLSLEGKFTHEQDIEMLKLYFETDRVDELIYNRFILYKPVNELWTALWARVQIANNNLKDSLENLQKYEGERFNQCLELTNQPEFEAALNSLKKHVDKLEKETYSKSSVL